MEPVSRQFRSNAARALHQVDLQSALRGLETGFVAGRARCRDALPEFEALRTRASEVLDHTLEIHPTGETIEFEDVFGNQAVRLEQNEPYSEFQKMS